MKLRIPLVLLCPIGLLSAPLLAQDPPPAGTCVTSVMVVTGPPSQATYFWQSSGTYPNRLDDSTYTGLQILGQGTNCSLIINGCTLNVWMKAIHTNDFNAGTICIDCINGGSDCKNLIVPAGCDSCSFKFVANCAIGETNCSIAICPTCSTPAPPPQ